MVDHIFAAQYGLITRAAARAEKLTSRQIDLRLERGEWLREQPGVFRHAAVPRTWESELLGACLGTGGVVSHRCASILWGLEPIRRAKPEISVPIRTNRRVDRVIVHRSKQWDRVDATSIRGIPVTGLNRTLIDCGAVVTLRTLERMAESAIRKGLTSWPALYTSLVRHSRQGRDGCGRLRSLLEIRLDNGTVPLSDFSRIVCNLLTDHDIEPPELEYRIVNSDGAFIMQTDLAWPRKRKAWELDGLAFHFGRLERERDNRKRNRAKAEGWNIQEILWSMYAEDPEGLVDTCRRFLAA